MEKLERWILDTVQLTEAFAEESSRFAVEPEAWRGDQGCELSPPILGRMVAGCDHRKINKSSTKDA